MHNLAPQQQGTSVCYGKLLHHGLSVVFERGRDSNRTETAKGNVDEGGSRKEMILSLIQFELFLLALDCFGWAVILNG